MANKTFKKEIFQNEILAELNSNLRQMNDSRLSFVSVTKVELTPDCAHAKVFWDTFDSTKRGDAAKAITSVRGKLRTMLAQTLKVRHVPDLSFEYDSQYEAEQKITDILKDAKNHSED